jgi:isopentenyl diphosphate isomerase/L-lactate dehydrogenase-like FMN-dependent dehydrogenase
MRTTPRKSGSSVTAGPGGRSIVPNDGLNWDELRALRRVWPHKLLVKGVVQPADATRAAHCGADGVIVSNHGGAQPGRRNLTH